MVFYQTPKDLSTKNKSSSLENEIIHGSVILLLASQHGVDKDLYPLVTKRDGHNRGGIFARALVRYAGILA